jgi:hypothetical protein
MGNKGEKNVGEKRGEKGKKLVGENGQQRPKFWWGEIEEVGRPERHQIRH